MAESWSKKHTCRICLKKFERLDPLEFFSKYFLVDIILSVNKKLEKNADLPDKCCVPCSEKIKVCHDFKQQCESSNEILIKYYDKLPALLVNLQLVNLENKDDSSCHLNLENPLYSDGSEPVVDYKKEFISNNKCFDNHKFITPYSIAEKADTIVLDSSLEKKLKTLSVKEIEENIQVHSEVLYTFKKRTSTLGMKCCHICNYIAPYPSALSRHLRTHTKERPFTCEACLKTFSDISTLNKHKFSHSDNPQYICDMCGKQFTFRTSLLKHLATHSEEKFECSTCKKVFSSKFNLNSHAKRHIKDGQFVCEICGKKRVSKYNLDIHKRVHSGEQQFACKDCSYKTVSKAGLIIHERTHSGEKPYPCVECDKKFISGLQLQRHLLKKHRKKKLKVQ